MRPKRRQPSPDPTSDIQEMLQMLLARQERIEAMLEQLVPPPEPAPEPEPERLSPLVLALGAAFGASGFTSREAWHRACTSDGALWVALETEGIKNVHHLGHWLGDHKGAVIERSKPERAGVVWHCDLRSVLAREIGRE